MFYAINGVKEKAKDIDFKEKIKSAGEYVYNKTEVIQNTNVYKGFVNTVSYGFDAIKQKTEKYEENKNDNNQTNNQNIPLQNNSNDNIQSNPLLNQNNSELNAYDDNYIKNNDQKFQSNYSFIDHDKNEQYNNYEKEISEEQNHSDKNNNDNDKIKEIEEISQIHEKYFLEKNLIFIKIKKNMFYK